jgi:hypothetical protein
MGNAMPRSKKMKKLSLICAMAAVAAFAAPAHAIYKCTTAKGVVYQDRPCREGNETDVQIVIPTGEVAPRSLATPDDGTAANGPRVESRFGGPKPGRTNAGDPVTVAKPADRNSGDTASNATDGSRKKETRTGAENAVVPLSAEQARKTDPSAKYYATDGFGTGGETPAQMNCESPTGEKRVFYLTNGKLTSI